MSDGLRCPECGSQKVIPQETKSVISCADCRHGFEVEVREEAPPFGRVKGAWIFVSHSHRDLEKVREVRNALERRGHNPILFYLKCMDYEDTRLPRLIREEIQARDWFVLCDSPNAQESEWVQQEMELIKSMEGKVFETIDLGQYPGEELSKIDRLSKRATVFLSHCEEDRQVAETIREVLVRHDFLVWSDPPDSDAYGDHVDKGLREATEWGWVLWLLSPASLSSNWSVYELRQAHLLGHVLDRSSNLIPVVVEPLSPDSLPERMRKPLLLYSWFDLTTGDLEQRVEDLIQSLKTRELM
ncbi:toll/interleukin-1 receptor domain-containing protein [Gemmatimonadota bacterium]